MTDYQTFLVKFLTNKIRYPQQCPVCGKPATTEGLVFSSASPGGGLFFSVRSWIEPLSKPHRSINYSEHQLIRLHVPVCDLHYSSPEEKGRIKGIATMIGGLGTFTILLMGSFILLGLLNLQPIYPPYLLLLIFGISMALPGHYLLRDTPLEHAVRIYYPESSQDMICLEVRELWYAKALLALNPNAVPLKRIRR